MARTDRTITLEDVVRLARQLSPVDKVRLIEQVAPELERELADQPPAAGLSLLGALKEYGPAPSEADIDQARREVWANFPRDDI